MRGCQNGARLEWASALLKRGWRHLCVQKPIAAAEHVVWYALNAPALISQPYSHLRSSSCSSDDDAADDDDHDDDDAGDDADVDDDADADADDADADEDADADADDDDDDVCMS